MAGKSGVGKIAGDAHRKSDAGDEDRLINELRKENLILKEELRSRQDELEIQLEKQRTNDQELDTAAVLLRESEAKYRGLVENVNDWIWEVDEDNVYTYSSPRSYDVLGHRPEELLGKRPRDFMAREEAERISEMLRPRFAAKALVMRHEGMHVHRDGHIVWVEVNALPIFDKEGNFRGYRGITRDITERKRIEGELRSLEEKSRNLIKHAPTGIYEIDFHGPRFVSVNDYICQSFGYAREELLAMDPCDLLCDESKAAFRERIRRHLAGERADDTVEYRGRAKDGRILYFILKVTFTYTNGKPRGAIVVGHDVTERRLAEEALRESEEKFRAIADTSRASITLYQNCRIVYANKASADIFGYSLDERCRMCFTDMIHPHYRDLAKKRMQVLLKDEADRSENEYKVLRKDGEERWVLSSGMSLTYRGKPAVIVNSIDITKRKHTEEELKAAKQEAELYLDLMGHDINNLHQIALGYLELARDMPAGEEQARFLDKPVEVLQRSALLIQNVRKLQKLRDGVFKTELIDVCAVLGGVQDEFVADSGKRMFLNVNGHERCYVKANELLHDVFANLVSNAIKHTRDQTNIIIDMDVVKENGTRFCRVMVEDDGPGIPDSFKAAIFNRTLKGTNRARGMGLGLYLVKSLVDSYGGRVRVEDRVFGDHMKGAKFVVMLPVIDKQSY